MLLGDVRGIVFQVLEVPLLCQRRLADVVVGGDAIVVRDLGEFADIVHVVAADVDVDEYRVPITELALDQVIEVLADGSQCLRKSGFQINCIDGQIHDSDSRVSELVNYVGTQ